MHPMHDKNRISSINNGKLMVGLLLVTLPLTMSLAGCGEPTKASVETAARPVKVAVLTPGSGERTLSFSGVVRPRIESAIGFRVAGKVVERLVNVGDQVAVGQTIARLDDTDLELAEQGATAAVAAARTRRDVAASHLERARRLL